MLTLVAMDQKDYKMAFESVGKMLSENSSSADAWYLRASIYYQLRQYQNAIKDLNRLLSFRPNYERAHILAGNIFRDNGEYKQAAKMYERAIKYKNSISSQVQLADMLARMRNYQEAENILQKMTEVQASYYPIYKVRVRIALMTGNYEEAGKYLTELQGIENDVELYVLWGAYYNVTHQSERAHAALETALKMDPGHPEALALKKEIK